MHPGDIVTRRSYGNDLLFTLKSIHSGEQCTLHSLGSRLLASAPASDLAPADGARVQDAAQRFRQTLSGRVAHILARRPAPPPFAFAMPGKVLHIDADEDYLRICAQTYTRLAVPNVCISLPEEDQPNQLKSLLHQHLPDILVLTGHDALSDKTAPNDISQYKTTEYFAEAVRRARQFCPSRDGLAIIAGACQSHFEMLLAAGANAASAPKRMRIHALDPLLVAEKIAYTPIDTILPAHALIAASITGASGIGGCQTRGMLRYGAPRL